MFLFRRTGVLVEKLVHPPSTSSHKGSNDVAQVSVLDDTSTGSSSTTSVASALERCVICEQTYTSFPKASQREHSIPPQGICIACVEQSLGIADTDEYHTQQSPSSDFQASFLRIDTDGSDHLFCLGCHQRLPLSNFPEGFIVESCRHEPGVCLDCIEKSIIESLDNELPQVISCPQCGDTMSEGDVWRFSGNQTFQRYEKMIRSVKEQDCAICAETLRVSQFPDTPVTDRCTHEPNTCSECISRHIESQLESRMWDQLSCPECPALFGYTDVEKHATKATFQKYDFLTMRNAVSSDPNFRWCTAAECSSGQVHPDGAESPLMICNSCRGLSCFTHQSPWHEGMTCVEFDNPQDAGDVSNGASKLRSWRFISSLGGLYDRNREISVGGIRRKETDQEKMDRKLATRLSKEQEGAERKRLEKIERDTRQAEAEEEVKRQDIERRARETQERIERQKKEQQRQAQEAQQTRMRQQKEESASTTLLQANTKACPGNCGWRIEKKDGCDHMKCSRCRHEFCWICLAPWEPIRRHGNSHHLLTCKYNSRNL